MIRKITGLIVLLMLSARVASAGPKSAQPTTGWWHVTFTGPLNAQKYPGCTAVTGDVTELEIVFDEGTDIGEGSVVLDNINVNGKMIGKPFNP